MEMDIAIIGDGLSGPAAERLAESGVDVQRLEDLGRSSFRPAPQVDLAAQIQEPPTKAPAS